MTRRFTRAGGAGRLSGASSGNVLVVDDDELLFEWQAAREAYDELLGTIFAPGSLNGGGRPDATLLREATRRRGLDEAARRRYYASRGLDDG